MTGSRKKTGITDAAENVVKLKLFKHESSAIISKVIRLYPKECKIC